MTFRSIWSAQLVDNSSQHPGSGRSVFIFSFSSLKRVLYINSCEPFCFELFIGSLLISRFIEIFFLTSLWSDRKPETSARITLIYYSSSIFFLLYLPYFRFTPTVFWLYWLYSMVDTEFIFWRLLIGPSYF